MTNSHCFAMKLNSHSALPNVNICSDLSIYLYMNEIVGIFGLGNLTTPTVLKLQLCPLAWTWAVELSR